MKTMNVLLGIGLMIDLSNYSSSVEKSEHDREVELAHYKTFDWKAQRENAYHDPSTYSTLLQKRIYRAVERHLAAKGYQKLTTGDPDFLTVYHFRVEDDGYRGYGHRHGYLGFGFGHRGRGHLGFGFGHRGHRGYGRHGHRGYNHYGYGGYGHHGHRGYNHYGYGGYGHRGHGGYSYDGYGEYRYRKLTLVLDFVDPESNELLWRGTYVGRVGDREISDKRINKAVKRILKKFPAM